MISSAKSRWLIICPDILKDPPILLRESDQMFSKYNAKSIGLSMHPVWLQFSLQFYSVSSPLTYTEYQALLHRLHKIWISLLLKPYYLRTFHRTSLLTESNAFLKSTKCKARVCWTLSLQDLMKDKYLSYSRMFRSKAGLWLRRDFLCSFHSAENHFTEYLARNIYKPYSSSCCNLSGHLS